MKNLKKAISLFMTAITILASAAGIIAMSGNSLVAYANETEGIFSYIDEGDHILLAYCDFYAEGHIEIPETIEGKPVTVIGTNAFYEHPYVTSVDIPDTVVTIGQRAFAECPVLTDVELPAQLEKIDNFAFANCTALKSITIPDSIKSIGGGVFNECTNLESVIMPSSAECSIGSNIFSDCVNLKSFNIPDGTYELGGAVFWNCPSLERIVIPGTVKEIGYATFLGCESLESIILGNGIESIIESAFAGCSKIREIHIPASVAEIDSSAFNDCFSLSEITVDESSAHYLNDKNGVLYTKDMSELVKFPANLALASYTIPNGVTRLAQYSFCDAASLKNLNIPASVTSLGIDYLSEENYRALTYADIEKYNVDANNSAFSSDENGVIFNKDKTVLVRYPSGSSATSYTIPDGVEEVALDAFRNCSNLNTLTIPKSVTKLSSDMGECENLRDVYYGGSRNDWNKVLNTYYLDTNENIEIHYQSSGGIFELITNFFRNIFEAIANFFASLF